MRWTKGKSAATAPRREQVLFGFDSGDGIVAGFVVGYRDESTTYYGEERLPITKSSYYRPGGYELTGTPDRFWLLPAVQRKVA